MWTRISRAWEEKGQDQLLHHAPALVLIHIKQGAAVTTEVDVGIASTQMILMAETLGLGTCFIHFLVWAIEESEDLREFLKLPKENRVLATFTVGYPDVEYLRLVARRPASVTGSKNKTGAQRKRIQDKGKRQKEENMRKCDQKFQDEIKKKLDVDLLGVASVKASKELKKQAEALLPGAKSVVILGKEVFKEIVDQLQAGKEAGEAIAADFLGPHAEYLAGRLTKSVYDLAAILKKEGYRSFPLPSQGTPVDQRFLKPIFSFKQAAVLAGLGNLGWHSMVITPEYGPRVRFAGLLTDAPLKPSPASPKNNCLQCNACIQICPAGALKKPKKAEYAAINPFSCRTYRGVGITCSLCLKACDAVHTRKRLKAKE